MSELEAGRAARLKESRRQRVGLTAGCAIAIAAALFNESSYGQAATSLPLHELTATQAAERIRSGDIRAVDLIEHALDRIDAHAALNAFISVDREGALRAAAAVDRARERGVELGPLAGVPLAIKDNINTRDLPTTAGTPALATFRPEADAPVVARLVAAGAIVVGKANLHELALGITSANAGYGFVVNAYSARHYAGGSSGGTGAAVGARLVPAGLGTDTGGSVRIPAAFNGIAGLRPTIGRYPSAGMVTLSRTRDTAGPMARTVGDLALLDSAITGYDQPIRPVDLASVRLGLPDSFWADIDPETAELAQSVVEALRARGATIVDVSADRVTALVAAIAGPLTQYEIRRDLSRYLAEYGTGIDAGSLIGRIASADVREILTTGAFAEEPPSAERYRESMTVGRPALQAAFRSIFAADELDGLIFPTTVRPAATFEETVEVEHNGRPVDAFALYVRNTEPGSLAGLPGLSLPIGLTAAGLPVGIEIDGPHLSDRGLLSIGLAIEQLVGPLPPPPE